ncbi:acetyl-CoA carboxylase biotin carboxyl carrier protein [Gracilibacillus sp. YIM 98692]|uniref:acetyl-CoA carboxylase biotin carboxyl carrier protein n=1 Tax=Gracilibacillus sp. YIM 98692 TaxID=2663532 RepID=UPI0013D82EFE|nr:acetyl-CoA carboxylase biotin carboxyl carrier protein [Gracilibacillus sp. YIM 98692]
MLSIEDIHSLIEKLDQSSIDEFSYEANGAKIELRKNKANVQEVVPAANQAPVQVVEKQAAESTAQPSKDSNEKADTMEADKEEKADYDHEIVSPMVGTFYSSPSPDKPVYVQVGDKVQEDSTVCIVEAMKLFNEIEAETNGTITEILVENGELVEYGQPLFRIKTA